MDRQVTNTFSSKEEENKFYFEAGKASERENLIALINEMAEAIAASGDAQTMTAKLEVLEEIALKLGEVQE